MRECASGEMHLCFAGFTTEATEAQRNMAIYFNSLLEYDLKFTQVVEFQTLS